MPLEITPEDRAARLRAWASSWDANISAAVELLVWHEGWLLRASFLEACVTQPEPGLLAIDWRKAQRFAARVRSSTSERAVLDAAVMLALREESWLRFRGDAHARAVVTAIAAAMEVDLHA
jgi:hypothetical protein